MSLSHEVRRPRFRLCLSASSRVCIVVLMSYPLLLPRLGRIWCLRFYVKKNDSHQPGPWAVMIKMMEQSPPTHLDARIVIKEPEKEPPTPPPAGPPPNGLLASLFPSLPRPNPPIEFRLKTNCGELTAVRAGRRPDSGQKVQALFTDCAQGNSLQYP